MRFMLKVKIPTRAGNAAVQNNSFGDVLGRFLEQYKPEATYFGLEDGQRTMFSVIDVQDAAQIPSIGEPFFMGLEAHLEFSPVMNVEDLHKGLAQISQQP